MIAPCATLSIHSAISALSWSDLPKSGIAPNTRSFKGDASLDTEESDMDVRLLRQMGKRYRIYRWRNRERVRHCNWRIIQRRDMEHVIGITYSNRISPCLPQNFLPLSSIKIRRIQLDHMSCYLLPCRSIGLLRGAVLQPEPQLSHRNSVQKRMGPFETRGQLDITKGTYISRNTARKYQIKD